MPKSNPNITIINAITNFEVTREMTDEEFALWKISADKGKQLETEAEAKSTARQVIANRLGLTADELQVLLG